MRNSELAQVLRAANPWWSRRRRATWVLDDADLASRARHEWAPATAAARSRLAAVADRPRPGTVTLLVGMRGVGKTTAVKDVVAHLVADPATDPRRIVLFPVQLVDDAGAISTLRPTDLATALRTPTRTGAPACDGHRVLVVDEVGAVAGWPRMLADACRRGDQVLATTSVLDPADLAALTADVPAGALAVRHLQPASMSELLLAQPAGRTQDLRAEYLRHGGLPRAIAEHRDLGDVGDELVASLAAGLHVDVCRGEDGCPLDVLLSAVCATTDRFVEPEPLAQLLGLSTPQVGLLLSRLEQAHVLDPRRGLVDPLLHRLPSLLAPGRHTAPSTQHIATFSH
ncbi:AAA family ATPase [Cellulomonas xiejunii]|uniref:AAA family ATPase n=1 Tax=Cellulomonas xiejunii TaxID=2968083 RepID=A0ABY5KLG3_9CELL|nr:AAA family ATPase [Cellulomonas xiejunii]MCC2315791.1 AAA family ATPase [Cellulomonas xiejunii]MCC2320862.1 AAA family ATPase [Cellulomonas xiejunii]UUI71144.1 AAA family ATPase [Cellulomonas xiejunii]